MDQTNPHQVPDGQPVRTLAGGLTIVRRMKHEYRPGLESLPAPQREFRTGKQWGSKFNQDWPLPQLISWKLQKKSGIKSWISI